jgi:hypothetical protein
VLGLGPAERADLGERGRGIVAERADQARCLGAVEALYMKIAGRAAPGASL